MNFDWQSMYGDIQKKAEEQQRLKEKQERKAKEEAAKK